MKKKKVFLIYAMLSGVLCFSQVRDRVGINTDNPQYTLDIEGTMRISKLGDPNVDGHLIGWDSANGQVVDMGKFSEMKFFKKIRMSIPVVSQSVTANGGQFVHNKLVVEDKDLGFDASKYSLFLIEPKLVYKNDENNVAYMTAIGIADKDWRGGPLGGLRLGSSGDVDWVNRVSSIGVSKASHGFLSAGDGDHTFQGTLTNTQGSSANSPSERAPFLYEIPKVLIYKKDNRWKFTGTYNYSGSADKSNSEYMWVFDLFVVDNVWVQYIDNVNMTVSNNSAGLPVVVTPGNGVKYPVVK